MPKHRISELEEASLQNSGKAPGAADPLVGVSVRNFEEGINLEDSLLLRPDEGQERSSVPAYLDAIPLELQVLGWSRRADRLMPSQDDWQIANQRLAAQAADRAREADLVASWGRMSLDHNEAMQVDLWQRDTNYAPATQNFGGSRNSAPSQPSYQQYWQPNSHQYPSS